MKALMPCCFNHICCYLVSKFWSWFLFYFALTNISQLKAIWPCSFLLLFWALLFGVLVNCKVVTGVVLMCMGNTCMTSALYVLPPSPSTWSSLPPSPNTPSSFAWRSTCRNMHLMLECHISQDWARKYKEWLILHPRWTCKISAPKGHVNVRAVPVT